MKHSVVFALVVTLSAPFPLPASAQSYNPGDASGGGTGNSRSSQGVYGLQNPVIQGMVDGVSTDALMSTLRTLQNFGTRYDFSPQREASAAWLLNRYQQLGLEAHAEPFTYVDAHLSDIDFVNDNCAFLSGSSGLLAGTTDGGATWTQLSPGTSTDYFDAVDFIDDKRGWVVGNLGACFRTTDAGKSWTTSTITPKVFHAIAFLNAMTGLVAGEGGAILRTTNGGSTWLWCAVSVGNIALRELKLIDAQHCWAVGDSGVILTSQDAGLTWVRQSSPVKDQMYGIDFVDGLHGWAVGGKGYWALDQGEGVLLKTTDGGQTWRQLANPPGAGCLGGVYALDSLRLWIADPRGRLFLSTDGGESWQMKLDLMVGNMRRFAGRVRGRGPSRIGFIGREGLLYLSSDGGASWEDRTLQLPAYVVHTSSNIVATLPGEVTPNREVLLLAHYDSRSNTPMTFAPGINDNGSGTSLVLEAARVLSSYRFASTLRFLAVSAEEMGLIGSSVYARTMRQRGADLVGAVNTDMVGYPVTGDSLRLVVESYNTPNALSDSVLQYQARYGINTHLTAAVDSTPSSDHVSFSQTGYTAVCLSEGTAAEVVKYDPYLHKTSDTLGNLRPGMVRRATQLAVATAAEFAGLLGVSAVQREPALPTEISLWQNYPNPFNPATQIQYTIGQRQDYGTMGLGDLGRNVLVQLIVYDVLGREVAVLVKERQRPGNYQVRFEGTGLSSGVYIYRLHAGSFTEAHRMMLLK